MASVGSNYAFPITYGAIDTEDFIGRTVSTTEDGNTIWGSVTGRRGFFWVVTWEDGEVSDNCIRYLRTILFEDRTSETEGSEHGSEHDDPSLENVDATGTILFEDPTSETEGSEHGSEHGDPSVENVDATGGTQGNAKRQRGNSVDGDLAVAEIVKVRTFHALGGRDPETWDTLTAYGVKFCRHLLLRLACSECPDEVCPHLREQDGLCPECKGQTICPHLHVDTECKLCRPSRICEHGKLRSTCKDCGGGSICEHGKLRSRCKDCGGGSICEHGKLRST